MGKKASIAEFIFEFRIDGAKIVYSYGKKSCTKLVYENLSIDNIHILQIDRRVSPLAKIELEGAEHLKKDVGESEISLLKYIKSNSILDDTKTNKIFSAC